MREVEINGSRFQVTSASDVLENAEIIEFRRNGRLMIAVTQHGDYGSGRLSVYVPQEAELSTVECAISHARKLHGV